jgi:hypothetical protein
MTTGRRKSRATGTMFAVLREMDGIRAQRDALAHAWSMLSLAQKRKALDAAETVWPGTRGAVWVAMTAVLYPAALGRPITKGATR